MNGGALPFVLMFAAIGLALALADTKAAWLGIAGLTLGVALVSVASISKDFHAAILIGFWLSMIGTAALVLIGRPLSQPLALAAAVNDGAWAGALAAFSESLVTLIFALPISLLFLAGSWSIGRSYRIVPKVLSSWLIAVGALAMFVSLVSTPGYEADHME